MAGEIPSTQLDLTSPAGSRKINLGDDDIRLLKTQFQEILDVDHDVPTDAYASDVGQHKQVTLQEQADIGTGAEGVPILGAQTVSGKAELVFTDEDDNDIQVTSGGHIDGGSVRLDNDEDLTATDNAGTGTVALIKANTSDQAEITPALLASGGTVLPEITAPTTDANQGAIYTKNDGTQTELYFREESDGDEVQITKGGKLNALRAFGSWSTATSGTASTDILVVAYTSNGSGNAVVGYTPNGTLRVEAGPSTDQSFSIMFPVKSGDTWTVTGSDGCFYLPLS